MKRRIAIIGGCGRVGLPLGLAFAHRGFHVTLIDNNPVAVNAIGRGEMPFLEEGAQALLTRHIDRELVATTRAEALVEQDVVIFVTSGHDLAAAVTFYREFMTPTQLVVLRSTLALDTVPKVEDLFFQDGWKDVKLAFCPERIAQGRSLVEIGELPQIVSANSAAALSEAKELFASLGSALIELEPREAEAAKLMTNAWRYMEFAVANQFYMLLESEGLDFKKIYAAATLDYPRAKHFPKAGLAAGPCLVQDTLALSERFGDRFPMGKTSLAIHNAMAEFLVTQLGGRIPLRGARVALLGLSFKADSDDTRMSLSHNIRLSLEAHGSEVLVCDPYVSGTVSVTEALASADGAIVAVPHRDFVGLKIPIPYIDCWNVVAQ